jgi:hypothetical protein
MLLLPPPASPIRKITLPGKLHQLQLEASLAVARLNAALASTSPAIRRAANQPDRWLFIAPESADPFGTRQLQPAARPSGTSFGPPRANPYQPPARVTSQPAKGNPQPAPNIEDLLSNL